MAARAARSLEQDLNAQARSAAPDRLTSRTVLAIAVPMAIANVSAPLTGAIDTAVIGQTGQAHLIGAVALGSTIFTLIYWGFGFLKIGTPR
jgi:Na+-driven multidrug efflux pump